MSQTQSTPAVEIAELRDLKRWTTYFSPAHKSHGIWWSTSRSLPGGETIELLVNDENGAPLWRGRVHVAIDPAIESDDPGVPLLPEGDWESLRVRLPDLTFVATEAIRRPSALKDGGS